MAVLDAKLRFMGSDLRRPGRNSSDGFDEPRRGRFARVAAAGNYARAALGGPFVLPSEKHTGWSKRGCRCAGPAPTPIGAAQFWLEASAAGAEIGAHDRRLWAQAAIAGTAGSTVIVIALGWVLRRLAAANRELEARSEDLQRANRELVLAAKTSALGAVTAHLMHELKNPLAGLEIFVAGQAEAKGRRPAAGAELAAASELTRRLRTMVDDVVGVLRDEQTGAAFQLSGAEVVEIVAAKVAAEAKRRGIRMVAEPGEIRCPAARPGDPRIEKPDAECPGSDRPAESCLTTDGGRQGVYRGRRRDRPAGSGALAVVQPAQHQGGRERTRPRVEPSARAPGGRTPGNVAQRCPGHELPACVERRGMIRAEPANSPLSQPGLAP